MYEVAGAAIKRARAGDGPSLIEAQTYRYFGHFGADDPLGYRTEEEEAYYHARDCIERLKVFMVDGDQATEAELAAIDERAVTLVEAAAKFANESPFPSPEELTTDIYISYP
jgi:pyruvate dehydrogenase E1 component alpha subunit